MRQNKLPEKQSQLEDHCASNKLILIPNLAHSELYWSKNNENNLEDNYKSLKKEGSIVGRPQVKQTGAPPELQPYKCQTSTPADIGMTMVTWTSTETDTPG